jgi:hypothetical protein
MPLVYLHGGRLCGVALHVQPALRAGADSRRYPDNQTCERVGQLPLSLSISNANQYQRWSAIVRGATAKGLESDGHKTVKFHKCRRHYGTPCCPVFVKGKHRESDSYIDAFTSIKRAGNQMHWLVTKGQELSTSVDVHGTLNLDSQFWPSSQRLAYLRLYSSDVDKEPVRLSDQVRNLFLK